MSRKQNTIAGLDIGSSAVRAIVAEQIETPLNDAPKLQIIGTSSVPSSGLRKGMVVDIEETVAAISKSLYEIERSSGQILKQVFVSIEGSHISTHLSKGTVVISRADGEVSSDDVNRAIESSQAISLQPNREIINVIPQSCSIDGQGNIKIPLGMNGVRLEVETLILEASTPAIKNLAKCLERSGLEVENYILAPMAAAQAVLSKKQKELGVALVDIGAGTTGVCVYEEGDIIHLAIIPVGGNHITNDVAIGLRSSIDLAEAVKIRYGSAQPQGNFKEDIIDFSKIDQTEEGSVSRYRVSEIIEARLQEIFGLVNKELKLAERQKLLPAGIVLTGGVANTKGISELAKQSLELPAHTGQASGVEGLEKGLDDPKSATLVGLLLGGLEDRQEKGYHSMSATTAKLKDFFRKFLP